MATMTNVESIAYQLDCGCPDDAMGFHVSGIFTVKTVGAVARESSIDPDGTPGYMLELAVAPSDENGHLVATKFGISHPLLTRESEAFPTGTHLFIKGHLRFDRVGESRSDLQCSHYLHVIDWAPVTEEEVKQLTTD